MDIPVVAGAVCAVAFAISNLPMLAKALRTRDVSSYSLSSLVIINAANVLYSVYVFTLPPGPVWALHTFYLVSCAIMLMLCLRARSATKGVASKDAGPQETEMTGALEETLGIAEPVVLGPFGGASSVELTATVSEAGGLGSFGLYGYAPERIARTIGDLRAATERPFAVNLWLPAGDEVAPGDVDLRAFADALKPLYDEVGIPAPEAPASFLPDFDRQWDAVLEAAPAVASFVYGVPAPAVIDGAHRRGILVVATATTVAEAVALDAAGVDAIVASGAEAAGHRVSFLLPPEQSLVGTMSLIPQVVDAVAVPVIAAGGVADRRGVAAAFALGASGVQVGTAFLRTRQSAVPPSHRAAIGRATDTDTVLTRAMSGRLARGIPNHAMREIETRGMIAPFPAQNWLTGAFRAEAAKVDRGELLSLWAGQSAALATREDAREVFAELIAGVPR
jgi:nitronate monooxygenase